MNVPQEIQEYIDSLSGDDAIELATLAFKHAINVGSITPDGLSGFILAEFDDEDVSAKESLEQYGVFLSLNAVRVRKVLTAAAKASLTGAERETYDNDFTIAYYPGEISGRIVEAMSRDMAIYTAGLLDGVDQVEARLDTYD